MGTVAPFRIKGGINLDGKVEFQVFTSAPSGVKADKMGVGSLAVASDTGKWYRKTTIGAGPDKWAALTTDTDLIGVAPSWLPPVDAVEARAATLAEIKSFLLNKLHIGGAEFYSTQRKRFLLTGVTDAPKGIYESCFYPLAKVCLQGDENYGLFMVATSPASGPTTAGNDLTLTMTINNPANATTTTCVITGNDIVINLKNDGTNSTATGIEVLRAVEAVDTDNLVYFHHTGLTETGLAENAPWLIVEPMAQTNFAGGGVGANNSDGTDWVLGPAGDAQLEIYSDEDGDWSDTRITTTINSMDGDTTTWVVYNEVTNEATIHLGNNGTAITATRKDVNDALNLDTMSSVYNQRYNDGLFNLRWKDVDELTVITSEASELGQPGGVGAQWGFEKVKYINPDPNDNYNRLWDQRGHTVYVNEGFEAGSTWSYNGSQWVKQGGSNATETAFIKNFIGKSADGNEAPTYTSTDVVTQGANLETAIGELDAEAGGTMGFVGKSEGDAMPSYGSTNAVTQNASLKEGISQLDLEVGYLQAFLGKAKGNEAPAYTTTKVVGQGTNLETAVSALDDLLGAAKKEGASANITTELVVDSIIMEQDLAAEWIVHAREVANPGNVYASKVFAIHNAGIGLAATQADFTESCILETGQKITGFEIGMDMEVAGPLNARTMRLLISSTDAVDVTLSREVLRRAA